MTSTIGLIGAGRMGLAIVTRLVQSGFAVSLPIAAPSASAKYAESVPDGRMPLLAWPRHPTC